MNPAHRHDLAVIHTCTRIVPQRGPGYDSCTHELSIVTSATRHGAVKAVRMITGRAALVNETTPVAIARLAPHTMTVIPATALRIPEALSAIMTARANPTTGHLSPYTSLVDLLRDLTPWTTSDRTCLTELRQAAYRSTLTNPNARCALCGVAIHAQYRIDYDSDDCPRMLCAEQCPSGVNFQTDYPIGLEVTVTDGFASGTITYIESVIDYYPYSPAPGEPPSYIGRSYGITLPYWGHRPMNEEVLRPTNRALTDQYAVRRPNTQIPTTTQG